MEAKGSPPAKTAISREVRMKSQLLILAAVFIFFVSREPLAAPEQQMCVCQFVAPVYRPFARQTNVEGTVRVTVLFDSAGKPTTVTALKDGPLPERTDVLRKSAVEAVRQWRFCPTSEGTEKRAITVVFNFRLREGQPSSTDIWSPTEVSFGSPATVNITTTAFRVIEH